MSVCRNVFCARLFVAWNHALAAAQGGAFFVRISSVRAQSHTHHSRASQGLRHMQTAH